MPFQTMRDLMRLVEATDPFAVERTRAEQYLRSYRSLSPIPGSESRPRSLEAMLKDLAVAPGEELESKWIEPLKALINANQEYWRNNQVADATPSQTDSNDRVLQYLYSRADQAAFQRWMAENYPDDVLEPGHEALTGDFESWLEAEFSVGVQDGLVTFWRLDDPRIEAMIGDLPVRLFHYTSSTRVASIKKHGLVSGKRSVNGTTNPGVYLTSESSGPAVTGYVRNATRNSRNAYGVRITVRVTLDELSPDEDDADITSGSTQWVTDYVSPSQIVSIERY
jgi:hypothetical protein